MGDHYITGREVKQSQTSESRVADARYFMDHFNFTWPLAVDNPEQGDLFLNTYGAWPTKFYIVQHNKIHFLAEPCANHMIHIEEVESALKSLIGVTD